MPTPIQENTNAHYGTTAGTHDKISVAWPAAPKVNSLLKAVLIVDKGSGAVTGPAGWTVRHVLSQAEVSVWEGHRVADGTETTVDWSWATPNGAQVWIGELPTTKAPVEDTAARAEFSTTATTASIASVTSAATTVADGLGIAIFALDSFSNLGTAAWTTPMVHHRTLAEGAGSGGQPVLSIAFYDNIPLGTLVKAEYDWGTGDGHQLVLSVYDVGGTPPPGPTVSKTMVGAVTTTEVEATANLENLATGARLVASTAQDLSVAPKFSTSAMPDATTKIGKHKITGLTPGTRYHLGWELDGTLVAGERGRIRTKYDVIAAVDLIATSCTRTDSNHLSHQAAVDLDPLSFVHMGDGNYLDLVSTVVADHIASYDRQLAQSRQALLARMLDRVVIVDDHDGGGDSAHEGSAAQPAIQDAVRRRIPLHPIPATKGLYRTFALTPQVRVIILDVRSFRQQTVTGYDPNDPNFHIIGAAQETWVKDTLANTTEPIVLVFSGTPYTDIPAAAGGTGQFAGKDSWGAYLATRTRFASILTNSGKHIRIAQGDQHTLGFDDGTNTEGGFPSFLIASMDQAASGLKGGPWSHGVAASDGARGQFARFRFTPIAGGLTFRYEAHGIYADAGQASGYRDEILVSESTSKPLIWEESIYTSTVQQIRPTEFVSAPAGDTTTTITDLQRDIP